MRLREVAMTPNASSRNADYIVGLGECDRLYTSAGFSSGVSQRGPWRSLGRQRVLVHLELEKRIWCVAVLYCCDILNSIKCTLRLMAEQQGSETRLPAAPNQSVNQSINPECFKVA